MAEKTFQQRIIELENQIKQLQTKLNDISNNTEEKQLIPYSKAGGLKSPAQNKSVDIGTGLGSTLSGSIIWNDADLIFPPYGTKAGTPTKGYNRHFHSRYAGGALDINTLEIIEYNVNWEDPSDPNYDKYNQHSQGFWKTEPPIKTDIKISNDGQVENVFKVGKLDLIFDPNKQKWGASAYEIDLAKCYFVIRDENGDIIKDENGTEMKSLLYIPKTSINPETGNKDIVIDPEKTTMVWDKLAKCWRTYAVFSEEAPEPVKDEITDITIGTLYKKYIAPPPLTILGVRG